MPDGRRWRRAGLVADRGVGTTSGWVQRAPHQQRQQEAQNAREQHDEPAVSCRDHPVIRYLGRCCQAAMAGGAADPYPFILVHRACRRSGRERRHQPRPGTCSQPGRRCQLASRPCGAPGIICSEAARRIELLDRYSDVTPGSTLPAVAFWSECSRRGGICGTQMVSVGSSGVERLSTAPATAGEALILASSARSRTARCDSVSLPVRSTSPMTETIPGPTISSRR
jgi:hypothetical protein